MQSICSSFTSSFSSSLSILSPIYPQTPPTFSFRYMYWHILNRASLSGVKPTSNRTEYVGFSSWQNPLKNQLWEDSFPLFLYLVIMNKFIFTCDSSFYDSYCNTSYLFDGLRFVVVPVGIETLKVFNSAKLSLVDKYSLQYFFASFKASLIIGRLVLIFVA